MLWVGNNGPKHIAVFAHLWVSCQVDFTGKKNSSSQITTAYLMESLQTYIPFNHMYIQAAIRAVLAP